MDREKGNPKFQFLFDNKVNLFVYSLVQTTNDLMVTSLRNIFTIDGGYIRYCKATQGRSGALNLFKCLKAVRGGSRQRCHLTTR